MATNMFKSMDAPDQDNLFAGPQTSSIRTDEILIEKGVIAKRGTLLMRDETTKLCSPITKLEDADENEYVPVPWCVLADNVDTTDGDVAGTKAVGYTHGEFNRERILFGDPTLTWQECEASARTVGIFFKPVVARVEA